MGVGGGKRKMMPCSRPTSSALSVDDFRCWNRGGMMFRDPRDPSNPSNLHSCPVSTVLYLFHIDGCWCVPGQKQVISRGFTWPWPAVGVGVGVGVHPSSFIVWALAMNRTVTVE